MGIHYSCNLNLEKKFLDLQKHQHLEIKSLPDEETNQNFSIKRLTGNDRFLKRELYDEKHTIDDKILRGFGLCERNIKIIINTITPNPK